MQSHEVGLGHMSSREVIWRSPRDHERSYKQCFGSGWIRFFLPIHSAPEGSGFFSQSIRIPMDSSFFADPDPGFKSLHPDPSIYKLMWSKLWVLEEPDQKRQCWEQCCGSRSVLDLYSGASWIRIWIHACKYRIKWRQKMSDLGY